MSDRLALIEDFGVKVNYETKYVGEGKDRHQITLRDQVRGIRVPFSAEDWMSVATREGGSYVGGCCANMSLLQDEINGVFRDGGFADADTLLHIIESARGHEGFEDSFDPADDEEVGRRIKRLRDTEAKLEADPEEYRNARIDPWYKLGVAATAVEPFLTASSVAPQKRPPHSSEEQDLVQQAADALIGMHWRDLLGSSDEGEEKDQHAAQRRINQARVMPVIHRLLDLLAEQEWPFEGLAVVEQGTDEPLSTHRGPCVYAEREYAQRAVELFERYAAQERALEEEHPGQDRFWVKFRPEIVPIKVDPENGLQVVRASSYGVGAPKENGGSS